MKLLRKRNLANFFKGKDILVTGGCGSIGSEIVKQLLKYKPKRIRVFDHNESSQFHLHSKLKHPALRALVGDIRDKKRVERALSGVDIVFHAAALKHVPLCEYNPYEAVCTNVLGTQNIIESAREQGVKVLVSISTDKAVNPVNTMGATKLLSERLVISAPSGNPKTRASCVRFGNVLNSDGSVIPIFREQIKKGGPVTITSPHMTRFFMSMQEAVRLVIKAAALTKGGEIFILKMKSLRITDLADVLIEELAPQHGHNPKSIKKKIIGSRPGEKFHELLINKEELRYVQERKDMYVLRPWINVPHYVSSSELAGDLDSMEAEFLTKEEIKDILKKTKIIE